MSVATFTLIEPVFTGGLILISSIVLLLLFSVTTIRISVFSTRICQLKSVFTEKYHLRLDRRWFLPHYQD